MLEVNWPEKGFFVNFRAGKMGGDYYAAWMRVNHLLPVGMALTVCE